MSDEDRYPPHLCCVCGAAAAAQSLLLSKLSKQILSLIPLIGARALLRGRIGRLLVLLDGRPRASSAHHGNTFKSEGAILALKV